MQGGFPASRVDESFGPNRFLLSTPRCCKLHQNHHDKYHWNRTCAGWAHVDFCESGVLLSSLLLHQGDKVWCQNHIIKASNKEKITQKLYAPNWDNKNDSKKQTDLPALLSEAGTNAIWASKIQNHFTLSSEWLGLVKWLLLQLGFVKWPPFQL